MYFIHQSKTSQNVCLAESERNPNPFQATLAVLTADSGDTHEAGSMGTAFFGGLLIIGYEQIWRVLVFMCLLLVIVFVGHDLCVQDAAVILCGIKHNVLGNFMGNNQMSST